MVNRPNNQIFWILFLQVLNSRRLPESITDTMKCSCMQNYLCMLFIIDFFSIWIWPEIMSCIRLVLDSIVLRFRKMKILKYLSIFVDILGYFLNICTKPRYMTMSFWYAKIFSGKINKKYLAFVKFYGLSGLWILLWHCMLTILVVLSIPIKYIEHLYRNAIV